ncbi:MAG TPA: lactoylglutathione lyase, partial [Rhodospirillaceae bacterium]|nr:lactoylglutathione lyase [Rhodospirillaceae bacterium]
MKYLHTMIRVSDLDESIDFFSKNFDMVETRR